MKPYDLSILEGLGDRQQLLTIVDLFLTNAPLQLQQLSTAANGKEWKQVYACAHKLKGSVSMFQAHELVTLLQLIEGISSQAAVDEEAINRHLHSLSAAFSKIEELLKEERNNCIDP